MISSNQSSLGNEMIWNNFQIQVLYSVVISTNDEGLIDNRREGKLYPNVRGCGYPPRYHEVHHVVITSFLLGRVDCQKYAAEFGKTGSSFPCFYSQLDPELVITDLDRREIYSTLLYCISIPCSLFVTAVTYLIIACWYIFPRPAQVRYIPLF